MREIKFRAWDKETKSMSPPRSLQDICIMKDTLADFAIMDGKLEFMQFTGLLDKQGKEIYEGDFQLLDYGRGKRIASVGWSGKDACFVYLTLKDGFLHACREVDAKMNEVIGNIYENPELLEKK